MSQVEKASFAEVFLAFLRLGLTSFGGPAAHVGYFRTEFVAKRQWLDESQFAQLLAISQFLPGPASSQLGFAIGLQRGGWRGALAAFLGFTIPSVLLLIAFAAWLPTMATSWSEPIIHGLKLVAVAVVLHGVIGMAKSLWPDTQRRFIGALAVVIMLLSSSAFGQMSVIVMGAVMGMLLLAHMPVNQSSPLHIPVATGVAKLLLLLFVCGLGMALLAVTTTEVQALLANYYRSGALVFGGGHVVLPLLDQTVVASGMVTEAEFMAGYGAAQAVPGPMFTLAAFLGFVQGGIGYALLAVIAIFVPGFLLLGGMLPYWHKLTEQSWSGRMVAGVNAAVVGLLAATLYDPIANSSLIQLTDWIVAAVGFALLQWLRANPLWVVLFSVGVNLALVHLI
jgi:chromate transporter